MGAIDPNAKCDFESCEKERISFINDCIVYDKPRLSSEKYPESVKVIADIDYCGDGKTEHKLDIYLPQGISDSNIDEAILLIHGGAFVYGFKELDKCFGMHLAEAANMPVININYRLAPDGTMKDMLQDGLWAVDYMADKYGLKAIHTTGDSAGGYLAYMMMLVVNNQPIRDDIGLVMNQDVKTITANPICGAFRNTPYGFPGAYFAKESLLPDYVYDQGLAARKFGSTRTVIITGDKDFLNSDNHYLDDVLKELDIQCELRDYESNSEREMHHVFPIAHPTWPESIDVIELMIKNIKGE